jgi:hypothetical protein
MTSPDKPVSADIVARLRKRAEIRQKIDGRKSVQLGEPDRLAIQLDEAADLIERQQARIKELEKDAAAVRNFFGSAKAARTRAEAEHWIYQAARAALDKP